jgi:hypothetical protein
MITCVCVLLSPQLSGNCHSSAWLNNILLSLSSFPFSFLSHQYICPNLIQHSWELGLTKKRLEVLTNNDSEPRTAACLILLMIPSSTPMCSTMTSVTAPWTTGILFCCTYSCSSKQSETRATIRFLFRSRSALFIIYTHFYCKLLCITPACTDSSHSFCFMVFVSTTYSTCRLAEFLSAI